MELKKKHKSIVYKRRMTLPCLTTQQWLTGKASAPKSSQISKEIDYFLDYYKDLRPVVFLSYEREAFYCLYGSDFRVTFDDTILYRHRCDRQYSTGCSCPDGKYFF